MNNKVKFKLQGVTSSIRLANVLIENDKREPLFRAADVALDSQGNGVIEIDNRGKALDKVVVWGRKTTLTDSTVFSGTSVIEQSVMPMSAFDYDAVVVLGDSITVGSFAGHYINGNWQAYADVIGIPPTVKMYSTGLSGHSFKTFTDRFVFGNGPSTPGFTFQEFETELAGKKVLFLSMLGANDLRSNKMNNPATYEEGFLEKKAEVETWCGTLRDTIVNSTAFDGHFAMMNMTYVDWRAGQSMRNGNLYEIIDGNVPEKDQRRFTNEVLLPLAKRYCPEFTVEDRFVFDMYAITRNVFRYWLSERDAVHPGIDTSFYIVKEFTKAIKQWIETQTLPLTRLDELTDNEWAMGVTSVVNFQLPLTHGNYTEKPIGLHITESMSSNGLMAPALLDIQTGQPIGRSYMYTDFTGVTGGNGNTGNETASIDSEHVTSTNAFSSVDKVLHHDGLPVNASFKMEICSASTKSGLSLRVSDQVTGNVAVIDNTENTGVGDHKKVTLYCKSDAEGVMDITVGSNTGGSFRIAGYSLTRIQPIAEAPSTPDTHFILKPSNEWS